MAKITKTQKNIAPNLRFKRFLSIGMNLDSLVFRVKLTYLLRKEWVK